MRNAAEGKCSFKQIFFEHQMMLEAIFVTQISKFSNFWY